jgi:DNA-binding LacI/PurR family transcriptional regulator
MPTPKSKSKTARGGSGITPAHLLGDPCHPESGPKGDHKPAMQADVAEAAGVSSATVSLALRNHPRISPATRERIQRIAARLGYRPDPALSMLTTYRHNRAPDRYLGTVAFVAIAARLPNLTSTEITDNALHAAETYCLRRGFKLEVFPLADTSLRNQRSLTRVLAARNVSGAVIHCQGIEDPHVSLAPLLGDRQMNAVLLSRPPVDPLASVVCEDNFTDALRLFEEIAARGYRRPGLLLSHDTTNSPEGEWIGAAHVAILRHGFEPCPRLISSRAADPSVLDHRLRDWIETHRPDVVVGSYGDWPLAALDRIGCKVPQQVAYVTLDLPRGATKVAGLRKERSRSFVLAAETVIERWLHRQVARQPEIVLHKLLARFEDGPTLPPRLSD